MNAPVLFGIATVPTIIGLVQVARESGLPDRYAPIASVILGVFAGLAQLSAISEPWPQAMATGLSLGLSATGLYQTATQVWPAGEDPASAPGITYPQTSAPIRIDRPLRGRATENNGGPGIVYAGGTTPDTAPRVQSPQAGATTDTEVDLNPFVEDR